MVFMYDTNCAVSSYPIARASWTVPFARSILSLGLPWSASHDETMEDSAEQAEPSSIETLLNDVYSFVWPVAGVTKSHLGQIHRVWLQQQFTPPCQDAEGLWPHGMVQLENVSRSPEF